eukprot:6856100-Pyramimonas_sp.AAC.1
MSGGTRLRKHAYASTSRRGTRPYPDPSCCMLASGHSVAGLPPTIYRSMSQAPARGAYGNALPSSDQCGSRRREPIESAL